MSNIPNNPLVSHAIVAPTGIEQVRLTYDGQTLLRNERGEMEEIGAMFRRRAEVAVSEAVANAMFKVNTTIPSRVIFDHKDQSVRPFGNSMAEDVLEFMLAMDQQPAPASDMLRPSLSDLKLAHQLLWGDGEGSKRGEVLEMKDAWWKYTQSSTLENLTEFVDGAIDSIYVILWTLNKLGVPADACWAEVQRSNMAKLGPDGKPEKDPETGKVKKPAGWTPPNLFDILSDAASKEVYKGGIATHADRPKG